MEQSSCWWSMLCFTLETFEVVSCIRTSMAKDRLTEVFESPPSCFVGPNGNQAFFEGAVNPGDGSGELYAEAARLLSPEPPVTGVVPPGFKPVGKVGNEMVRFGAPGR